MGGKRKKWTAEDKRRIVLWGMQPGIEVSEVCCQEGLSATLYYLGKKQLLGSASTVFASKAGRKSHEEERRASEQQRLKLPAALPKRVHEEVERTKIRSGWAARQTLVASGMSPPYNRWQKEEAWAKALPAEPVRPVQMLEALPIDALHC